MCIKPLRKMLKIYFRKIIPPMAWSPDLVELFQDITCFITSSPVLVRCDPVKPTFLRTYWSADGMGCIFMQPVND